MPEEDLHLSDHARSQAHRPSASAAWSFNFGLNKKAGKKAELRLKPMVSSGEEAQLALG